MEQALKEPGLRRMRLDDLPVVMEIERLSLSRPWGRVIWREELASQFSLYLVLEEGEEISGYIGVKLVIDELHIMTIAVHPERRRRGHARTLIEAALAARPDARRVYLEVRPSNLPARSLYESLGFEVAGRRPRYYGDEDALLMVFGP